MMSRLPRLAGALTVAAAVAALLAGCSSTTSDGAVGGAPAQATSDGAASAGPASPGTELSPPAADASAANGEMRDVGRITQKGTGWSLTLEVTMGDVMPPGTREIPQAVLEGCNWNYAEILQTTPMAHGKVQMTYEGSVPDTVLIGGAIDTLGTPREFYIQCASHDGSSYSQAATEYMQPGGSIMWDVWMTLPPLTNAQPTVSMKDTNVRAALMPAATYSGSGLDEDFKTTIEGPGAARCLNSDNPGQEKLGLLLFAKSPATVLTWKCQAP